MFVGMATFAGAAFRTAALGDQFVVRAAVDTGNMLIEASKFGFAVLIVATCVGEALPSLSSRFRTAGLVAAAALVLSAVPPFVVERGVGQFGGPIDLAGGVPALVWLSVLSISLAKTRWAFRLRWAPGPSRRTAGVVSATQTDFARFRDIPGAVLAALRLRRLVRRAPGAIGVSLSMRPLKKRGWSVSAWETEADLRGFLRSTAHQATARRFRSRVVVRSELWAVDRFDLAVAWHQADARWTNGA
jgi:heme-degrading monooxygenase HmoA